MSEKHTMSRLTEDVRPIEKIEFSMLSNANTLRHSVISEPNGIENLEIDKDGRAVIGGPNDPRLGVTNPNEICATCGETNIECPGHFGHIKLAEPVFHMGYLPILKNILSCICIKCSRLLVYKNESKIANILKNKHGKQRFQEIREICKKVSHCHRDDNSCGIPAHKITIEKKQGNIRILAEPAKKTTEMDGGESNKKIGPRILTPQTCYDILSQISPEDCKILGFDPVKSSPKDMIITYFPVPPLQVRPSIKMEILSASSINDDLSDKLVEIIRSNENLKSSKSDGTLFKSAASIDDTMLLQIHIATFFDNQATGIPKSQQKNKKPTKSVAERLRAKEGRIRGNLQGKRVDMSGRTVITSDPRLAVNEVGIPLIIAKNLTYPEIVTKQNIAYLTQLVKNGLIKKYPGANAVVRHKINPDGTEQIITFQLKYRKDPIELQLGDIVERHLVNGDMVLFNRQPSLHKMSMMGHIVHVIEDPELLTFRVNVSVTEPYNAD